MDTSRYPGAAAWAPEAATWNGGFDLLFSVIATTSPGRIWYLGRSTRCPLTTTCWWLTTCRPGRGVAAGGRGRRPPARGGPVRLPAAHRADAGASGRAGAVRGADLRRRTAGAGGAPAPVCRTGRLPGALTGGQRPGPQARRQ